jgi:iron complex transport system permease protein
MRLFKHNGFLLFLTVILLAIMLLSFTIGRYSVPFNDLLRYLFTGEYTDDNLPLLIMQIRLPRILMAVIVGGALAIAGTAYQGLFRNPMVSPDILGVSSGAGFGAALAITCSASLPLIQLSAFAAGLTAVSISLLCSKLMALRHDRILTLVLSGMVISALFSALIALLKYIADSESKLPEITFWLMGNLSSVSMKEVSVVAPVIIVSLIPLFLNSWKMNVLSFGDDEAKSMGVNIHSLRLVIICSASLLTASVVAVTGIIGWVGLIIPHLARFIVGPEHKRLLPAAFLTGASFLLLVDDLARSISALEIPLGVITSLIGAPVFLFALTNRKKQFI